MVEKIRFEVEGYECTRCKHRWQSRLTVPPRVCPSCKNPWWSVPKTQSASKGPSAPEKENKEMINDGVRSIIT